MDFMSIQIEGKGFVVTEALGRSILAMVREAERMTVEMHPEASPLVPVRITNVGPKAIAIIKEYRSLTGCNLRDAKRAIINEGRDVNRAIHLGEYTLTRAEEIAQPFRDHGATVSVPSPLVLLAREAPEESEVE